MNRMLIAAPSGIALPMTAEELNSAALRRWGAAVRIHDELDLATNIKIDVPGERSFQLDYTGDHKSLHCDGNELQQIEVAVWVRSLIPDDFPRVIAFDNMWNCHVDLVAGITEEQFRSSVVDHSVPGWNDDDPELQ